MTQTIRDLFVWHHAYNTQFAEMQLLRFEITFKGYILNKCYSTGLM